LDEDLLVICSDKVFSFDIAALCREAVERGGVINTYQDVGDPALLAGRFGCLKLDRDRRVLEFQEKPEVPVSSCRSIAFYVYPRNVVGLIRDYVGAGDNPDAPGYLSQWLCRRTPMFGWPIDGDCLDVGDPASYREANRICWEATGRPFQELRLFVDAAGQREERTLSSLKGFSDDRRVTLIVVAVETERVAGLAGYLRENPCAVPVNVMERAGENPAAQAAELDANLGVILRSSVEVDLTATAPAVAGEAVPMIEA
jgi:dTDP-glucose pyrophosphorylase